jgi:hypothetical protein
MSNGKAELELELRMLPGVLNVGFGQAETADPDHVSVVARDPEPGLERLATRVARGFRSAATIEIVDLSDPLRPAPMPTAEMTADERVALVESTLDATGQALVVLSWQGNSASGTGAAGALIGPAKATLEALGGLGVTIDASLSSVSSHQGVANSPVRVILRSPNGESEFVGVARGSTDHESAARATLAAFNRYVGARRATRA